MNNLSQAMQTVDDIVLSSRHNPGRDEKFARLRAAFSTTGKVGACVFIRNVAADGSQLVPAPYKLLPHFSSEARIAIVSSNFVFNDVSLLSRIKRESPTCLLACWMVDNHHIFTENQELCQKFDVIIPAQHTSVDYLYAGTAIVTSPSACPCVQWTLNEVTENFFKHLNVSRLNALYGGFRRYPHLPRNAFIECISTDVLNSDVELYSAEDQSRPECYLNWSADMQIENWMRYKTSVVVCVKNDIPMRLFDALVTGQIPIIPWDMVGLDAVISPEEQALLPILRYTKHTTDEVARMRDAAVQAFDRDGLSGILRRHNHAIERHMPIHRVRKMLTLLHNMARLSA